VVKILDLRSHPVTFGNTYPAVAGDRR